MLCMIQISIFLILTDCVKNRITLYVIREPSIKTHAHHIDDMHYICSILDRDVGPIGFTAHASSDKAYSSADTIEFAIVSANFGNHYNATTSSFHCPQRGVYFFSINFNTYKEMYYEFTAHA